MQVFVKQEFSSKRNGHALALVRAAKPFRSVAEE